MSGPTEFLLTDPDEAILADRLDRVAPSPMRGAERWRALLDEVADNAEGRAQLETKGHYGAGSHYVSAAWWTDHQGRKHVRVCAGDTSDGDWHPHYSQLDDDLRPPLWHVFMERVYRVSKPGEEPRWLVSCACGETGTAEELAWAGLRCGPCHDRREEGHPHPDDGQPAYFVGPGVGVALCFSPDGRLAASSGGGYLRLYDLTSGEELVLEAFDADEESRRFANSPLAFSRNGRWLLSGLPQEWVINWWDLAEGTEMPGELMLQQDNDEEARGYAFSPDGQLMASWSSQGHFVVMTAEGEELGHDRWGIRGYPSALAFSPDSRTLALGDPPLVWFLDTHTWEVSQGPEPDDFDHQEEEYQLITYTPDSRRLVCITGDMTPEVDHRPPRRRLHVFDLVGDAAERERPLPFHTRVAETSPDGRYLAYVVHDDQHSPGEVHFFDLVAWAEAGRLEWDPQDAVNDLAFSEDGQTLATISAAGAVKLWPWRLLLDA